MVAVLSEQYEYQGYVPPSSTPLNPQGPQTGLTSIPTEQVERCTGSCSAIRGRTTLGALCPLQSGRELQTGRAGKDGTICRG